MDTTASISTQNLTSQRSRGSLGSLLARTIATSGASGPVLARVALAVVMFPHGAQKLLGWWGGHGYDGTVGFLSQQLGLPTLLAASVVWIEFAAPLLLLAGLGTRWAALGIGAIMVGAIATVHGSQGFFMDWNGALAGEGYEYHLLALGLVGVLLLEGGGRASIDGRLAARRR